MHYYRRICEIAEARYGEEVARAERAGSLRVFYYGLLTGLSGLLGGLVSAHGATFADFTIGRTLFWITAGVSALGGCYTGYCLIRAIWPKPIGYLPLPKEFLDFAEQTHEYYQYVGVSDADVRAVQDIDVAVARRLCEVVDHNYAVNNEKAEFTVRAFYALLWMGIWLALTYGLVLVQTIE